MTGRSVLASSDYNLVTKWRVLGTVEEVYDLIGDVAGLPRWWPAAILEVLEIQLGDETGLDKVVRLDTKGWLPIVHHWHAVVSRADRPHAFTVKVWGDFEGEAHWRFQQAGAWTEATLEWRVHARKPVIRLLSPLLKPLFAWDHAWAMAKGEESLRLELARRHAQDAAQRTALAPPPAPAEFPTLPLLLGTGTLFAFLWLRRRGRRRRR